jgi:hypothetical protein
LVAPLRPDTDSIVANGLPSQEGGALGGNLAQDAGAPDGVSRDSAPSPTANFIALAAAGRNPTDITLPTAGSQAGGSGGDEEEDAVASSSGTTTVTAGSSGSSGSAANSSESTTAEPSGGTVEVDGETGGSGGSGQAASGSHEAGAVFAYIASTRTPPPASLNENATTFDPLTIPRCMACHGTGVSTGQTKVWELPVSYQWSIMRATGTYNPYQAQAAIDQARALKVQVEGELRAVGGAAAMGVGAGMSSTGVGAAAGVPLAAWGADQVYTGLQEVATGERQTSLGGQAIQAQTGTGTGGQILTGAYDIVPGLAATAYALRPGALSGPESGAAGATGGFNPASANSGGDGLGLMAGRQVKVTPKGIDLVSKHLATFESVPGEFSQNTAMVQRLQAAMEGGQTVSGADAVFYTHEAAEATMMARGMSYEAAHAAALAKYKVSPFSVYHPEVIRALPDQFNNNWRAFWGITQ